MAPFGQIQTLRQCARDSENLLIGIVVLLVTRPTIIIYIVSLSYGDYEAPREPSFSVKFPTSSTGSHIMPHSDVDTQMLTRNWPDHSASPLGFSGGLCARTQMIL